ncbi:MAG TPA: nuclear transport factor 2 family protein [Blastocatellia bacterium]|nr:nuclear transport factor 2 family protein [Blastocatellia bacterium]
MSTSNENSEKLTEAQQAILLLEEEIFGAVKTRDASALERVLADDFVYRSPGKEVYRDDFLKLCATFPYEITSIRGEELKVNVYGNLAVVTGLQTARTAGGEGKEETSIVAFTDVFVNQKGRWMLSLAHAVDLRQAPDQRS